VPKNKVSRWRSARKLEKQLARLFFVVCWHTQPSIGQAMTHKEDPDEKLMLAAGAGDDEAFTELIRRHRDLIYGTAYRMLGAFCSEAEDVAQQVFIRAYRAAPRYKPTAKFTTWLLTICRNVVFSQLKKSVRRRTVPLDPIYHENEGECPFSDPSSARADEDTLRNELEKRIQALMQELPPKQRQALILRHQQDLDYKTIAQIMGASERAVKSLLFRARDTLRERLKSYLSATY
jgi:RNA polymerase sigma-70 factor (ECF subfamily)